MKQQDPPGFVLLPRSVALRPPLRARGADPASGLTPFEFAIAAAAIACIRTSGTDTILSRSALLRAAEVPITAWAKALINDLLERLLLPPAPGLEPVLRTGSAISRNKIKLTANAFWLPEGNFVEVPLPIPTNGRIVTALFLFSHALPDRPKWGSSTLATLTDRLGLPSRPSHARRALREALELVNGFRRDFHDSPMLYLTENADATIQITTERRAANRQPDKEPEERRRA